MLLAAPVTTRTLFWSAFMAAKSSHIPGAGCERVDGKDWRLDRPGGRRTSASCDHQLFDFGDGLGRVEALGASAGAVEDGVAPVKTEGILEIVQSFASRLVAAIGKPAIGLQQHRGSEVAVAVPPVAGAGGRAAEAEDAFPQPVQLLAFPGRLGSLAVRRRRRGLEPGLDRCVLRVGVVQIR